MMEPVWVLVIMLTLMNAGQFFFWAFQIQKLLDKAMCRSFTEYVTAKGPVVLTPPKADDEPNEDLGPLKDFGV